MASLSEIRSKYPEYGYLSDNELADALHKKFYADMDRGEFDKRVGLKAESAPERSIGEAVTGLAKAAGSGLVRGAVGLGTLPGNLEALGRAGINYGAGLLGAKPPVSPETLNPVTYQNFMDRLEAKVGPLYKPQTTAEKYVSTIGEFAPAAIGGGGGLASKAAAVVAPAVASETAGQMAEGTSYEPLARVAGALAGTRLPNVGARAITPAPADASRQAAIKALEKEGVTALTAGQRTGNNRLRWVEDATAMVPGGGGKATAMQTQAAEQFTRSALKKAGIQADRATSDVLDGAFKAIGNEFDTFAQKATVKGSPQFETQLMKHASTYAENVPPVMQVPAVQSAVRDIIAKSRSPQGMSGKEFATYRSELRRLQRGMKQNPQASEAVGKIIDSLDIQMIRSAPKGQKAEYMNTLSSLNSRYRNMLAIEDAAGAAGEGAASGLLSPAALKQAVKKQNKKDYTRGRSELARLSRAGENVLRPLPSSGTAERAFSQQVVSAPGAVIGGIGGGSIEGALLGTVAPWALKAGTARAIMSQPVQKYFANQRIPGNLEPTNTQNLPAILAAILQGQ